MLEGIPRPQLALYALGALVVVLLGARYLGGQSHGASTPPSAAGARPSGSVSVRSGSESAVVDVVGSSLALHQLMIERVFASPMAIVDAWGQVERWLDAPSAFVPIPGSEHRRALGPLLLAGVTGPRVSDAHLAALAIEHGLELCSTDADFARFAGLRWRNPIAGG